MRLEYKSVTFLLVNNFFPCYLHPLSRPLTTGLPFTQKGCTIIFCILFQGRHTNLTSAAPPLGFYVKTTGNRSAWIQLRRRHTVRPSAIVAPLVALFTSKFFLIPCKYPIAPLEICLGCMV